MLRNFWKGRHGYSECNRVSLRVLQVDKRVSTEMSVTAFCGLTCDFSHDSVDGRKKILIKIYERITS